MKAKINKKILLIILSITLLAILLAGCSSVSAGATEPKTSAAFENNQLQTNTGGAVTIQVTYLGLKDNTLTFDVVMDTHSVNLDQYDLKQLATLSDGQGNKFQPISWDSAPGDHHRNGKLVFTQTDSQVLPGPLTLDLQNIAGIQDRVFTWGANIN